MPDCCSTIDVEVDGAVDQDQPQHREAHDQLVGDHLRAGAQRAQHRELVVRGPAGQHRADDRHAAEGEDDEEPGVEPRDLQRVRPVPEPVGERREQLGWDHRAAERDDREDEQHRREHDPRRDGIRVPVVGLRPPILLHEHLEPVGQAVEQAPPDELHLRERDPHVRAVGADAVRHHGRLLALDPRENGAERHQHAERVADVDRVDDEVLDHAEASTVERGEQRFGVGHRRRFRETRLERADDACEIRVVPAPLGLHAGREEHVGVAVLRREPRVQEDHLGPTRQRSEVEALAPDQHEVGPLGERRRRRTEQRARAGSVGILVRLDQEVVLHTLTRRGELIWLDESLEARAQRRLERGQLLVAAPARHERDRAPRRGDQITCGGDRVGELDRLPLAERLRRRAHARRSSRGRALCCRSTGR